MRAIADPRRRYAWEYDHAETTDVAKEISHECMTKVKDLMGEALRYKLIFHVCRLAFSFRAGVALSG